MAQAGTATDAGVVFKGRMMTLTVLELRETDSARIAAAVEAHVARAPGFFDGMPVLLSLPDALPDLLEVNALIRRAGMVPVGVLDADPEAANAAQAAGLAVMTSPTRSGAAAAEPARQPRESDPPREAEATVRTEEKPSRTPSRLITRPVRSGQQIYARGGDLVIASSVSEGAEVVADGHIHIYGALRGRALAGATGDTQARIYCRRFEPDLVAIAGCYKVADAIDNAVLSGAVVVHWDSDNLIIELQE